VPVCEPSCLLFQNQPSVIIVLFRRTRISAPIEFLAQPASERDDSFLGRSMTAAALVDWLVRRLRKGMLEDLWYDLTAICYEEFVASPSWKHVLWRSDTGENQTRMLGVLPCFAEDGEREAMMMKPFHLSRGPPIYQSRCPIMTF
jgi:hypothetical protein